MWKEKERISMDPKICHGQPCFKGTRIMVYLVFEMLESGETIHDILNAYPQLTEQHIQSAWHYAAEVTKIGDYISFAGVR